MSLEESVRFRREVRFGEEVDVSCAYRWGAGRTFRVEQEIRRTDGTLVAEIRGVGGLLDHDRRRLVHDPGSRWRAAASAPEIMGLPPHDDPG